MDDSEVLTATLNSTIQRHTRAIQNYEIEIVNLTAELMRTKAALEAAEEKVDTKTKPSAS